MELFLRELAARLLTHIEFELQRPSELIDRKDIGGQSPREWTEPVRQKLLEEFPDLEPSPHNFFEEVNRRSGRDTYKDTTFEIGSVMVCNRILDLRYGRPEFREHVKNEYFRIMALFDHKKYGLNSDILFASEAIMREICRDICEHYYSGEEYKRHWEAILNQGLVYQSWMSRHFEGLLTDAWQESENLLNNILPAPIISELKKEGGVAPVHVESASVLFSDFEGFTKITAKMPPERLIKELDICFKRFDRIMHTYNLEKIKTLGDGYMCAGGIPQSNTTHIYDVCMAALSIREAMREIAEERRFSCGNYWNVRIGIHTGELVAGIVGEHKFSYDIWGDTVNIASRLESSGIPGEINISHALKSLIDPFFITEPRGVLPIKNLGEIEMHLLKRLKPKYAADEKGILPNETFFEALETGEQCRLYWQNASPESPGRQEILEAL